MDKPVHTSKAKSVAPGIFNMLPGPRQKAESTYASGNVRIGYGHTKTEAEKKSRDSKTSYYKGKVGKK